MISENAYLYMIGDRLRTKRFLFISLNSNEKTYEDTDKETRIKDEIILKIEYAMKKCFSTDSG